MIRRALILAVFTSLVLGAGLGVHAQENYPARPVTVIVPFPPGQSADTFARLVGKELSNIWKQPGVIENKPGGLSIPGMMAGRNAEPDGYTLITAPIGALALNPGLIKNLSYDPLKDFAFIGGIYTAPYIFVAHPDAKISSIGELVRAARATPGRLSFGAGGTGQLLSIELFKQLTSTEIVTVRYKGSGQAVSDILGGPIQLIADTVTPVLPQIRAGKLRALAVTTLKRSPELPDTRTLAEQGYPAFYICGWVGLVAPKAAPPAIVAKISADLQRVLTDAEVQKAIVASGGMPDPRGAEEWGAFVSSEMKRWGEVMVKANIKPE